MDQSAVVLSIISASVTGGLSFYTVKLGLKAIGYSVQWKYVTTGIILITGARAVLAFAETMPDSPFPNVKDVALLITILGTLLVMWGFRGLTKDGGPPRWKLMQRSLQS